jgi:FkbM family methyltransferase
VKDYVKNKEIFDVGAFHGESLMVLEEYTNIRVRSYELIPDSAVVAQRYANHGNPMKHTVNNVGLSNEAGCVNISETSLTESSANCTESGRVKMTTIDSEVKKYNISIGFIKIDIEGFELEVLMGAMKTLKEQHPILSSSSYHNIELMDIPGFLEGIGGYRIEFENQGRNFWNLHEQVIMAYPTWIQNH